MSETNASPEVLKTPDGTPLKVALSRTLRYRKRTALLLVAPLFLLFGSSQGSGHYYGSDARRSPLDRYRAPGSPEYSDS